MVTSDLKIIRDIFCSKEVAQLEAFFMCYNDV